jgi:hypothetical protein
MSEGWTDKDQSLLEELERTIENNGGVADYFRKGEALIRIREAKLYRKSHGTFEEYCRDRWKITDDYARKLIRATEVVQDIQKSRPLVSIPESERVARTLVRIEPEKRAKTWGQVISSVPEGKKLTAEHSRQVVEAIIEGAKESVTSANLSDAPDITSKFIHDRLVEIKEEKEQEGYPAEIGFMKFHAKFLLIQEALTDIVEYLDKDYNYNLDSNQIAALDYHLNQLISTGNEIKNRLDPNRIQTKFRVV